MSEPTHNKAALILYHPPPPIFFFLKSIFILVADLDSILIFAHLNTSVQLYPTLLLVRGELLVPQKEEPD